MPVFTAVPNIRSQIERALRAYLTDCVVGTFGQFRLSHDYSQRQVIDPKTKFRVPLIDIFGVHSSEKPQNSRLESWIVRIDPEYDAATQPNDENPNWNWKAINNLVGLIMAAMSQTTNAGVGYYATALMISEFGRRLAVLGAVGDPSATSAADNSDMALFFCNYVDYAGAVGVKQDPQGDLYFKEQRNFTIDACNLDDDGIFPKLSFDGAATLNWTFSPAAQTPEPAQWNVDKSVDGTVWVTQETLGSGSRSANIAGTGTQFWRVTRTDASILTYMPESNVVKAVSP